eukprot:1160541-Pelagomonas_calceolata.AAC.5
MDNSVRKDHIQMSNWHRKSHLTAAATSTTILHNPHQIGASSFETKLTLAPSIANGPSCIL